MIEIAELPDAQTDKFKFKQVKDGRGRVIEGLWVRNDRYYGLMRVPGKGSRRIPLFGENKLPVDNHRDAQTAFRLLLTNRDSGELPQARRSPLFSDYFEKVYIKDALTFAKKSKLTLDKETFALRGWAETLGTLNLNQITRSEINRHLMKRKEAGCSNRTLNLDVIALGNCLQFAKEEGWVKQVVTDDVTPLDHKPPTRELVTEADVEKICAEATQQDGDGFPRYGNGQQLSDYVRFMLFTGARRESALWVKWENVDFANRRILLEKTKYSKTNFMVTFNDRLEKLLIAMRERKLESPWLFPNPFRLTDRANFRKTFDKVRTVTKLENFNFHDCRHFFISWAVMSGIDTLTISRWVGHTDGGVLIGSVYGHLNDEHLQAQAKRLSFGSEAPTAPASPSMIDLNKVGPAELLAILQKLQNIQAQAA